MLPPPGARATIASSLLCADTAYHPGTPNATRWGCPSVLLRRKLSLSKRPQAIVIEEIEQVPGTMGGHPGHLQSAKNRTQ